MPTDESRQPLNHNVKAVPMYTVTPAMATAAPVEASSSAPAGEAGLETALPVATPVARVRRRRFGFLGCGLGLLTVFLVLFLCMARQPFLRLVEIDLKYNNKTRQSTLVEKYDLFNDNYYSMSWHDIQLRQWLCADDSCNADDAHDLGTAYVNDTLRQAALSTRRINFEFVVSANDTALLATECKTAQHFDLYMMGHSKTKLWMGGEVDVGMGPQLYRVGCRADLF